VARRGGGDALAAPDRPAADGGGGGDAGVPVGRLGRRGRRRRCYCERNRVWFLWDGEHILLSIRASAQKYRNLRRDPRVAISFLDLSNPGRYVEIRGEAIEFTLFLTLDFVNQLARKYTGADYTRGVAGEERYRVTVRVDGWSGQE
jgi:PPOX class probable F420-dependent enzyme